MKATLMKIRQSTCRPVTYNTVVKGQILWLVSLVGEVMLTIEGV